MADVQGTQWKGGVELLRVHHLLHHLFGLFGSGDACPEWQPAFGTHHFDVLAGIDTGVVEESGFLVPHLCLYELLDDFGFGIKLCRQFGLVQEGCHFGEDGLVYVEERVQADVLLVHGPCLLAVFLHHGIVKAYAVVHAAFPTGSNESAVGGTVFADAVVIVVALGIPPLMELIELVEHCFEEFLVAGSFIHVHGSPGGYGRFGIAPVIVFLVVADEVGYHAVVGLIVEEGNHFAFGYLLVEMYVARSNLPGVPRPDAVDESVVRRVAAAMQDVTGRGAVVAVQGHHCFYEYLAVFVVLEVLAVSAQQRSDLCVPLLFV